MAGKKKKKSGGSLGQYLLIGALVLLISGILGGFVYIYQKTDTTELDPDTNCPKDQKLMGNTTAILLDGTDKISQETAKDINNKLAVVIGNLAKRDRVEIYVLRDGEKLDEPQFVSCNPGGVEDLDTLGKKEITANPRMVEERWQEDFFAPVNTALNDMLNISKDSEYSPLFYSIQQVMLNNGNTPPHKVLLISDMMENTGQYSVYTQGLNPDGFVESSAFNDFGADYSNTIVESWIIQRPDTTDIQSELKEFWANILSKYGVMEFRTVTLVGVQ